MLKVRPALDHGAYWEAQFGWLIVWVMAASRRESVDLAANMAVRLNYELIGTPGFSLRESEYPSSDEKFGANKEAARGGFDSAHVFWRPTGSDETEEQFTLDNTIPELPGLTLPPETDRA